MRRRLIPTKNCPVCGRVFERPYNKSMAEFGKRIFCSPACASAARRKGTRRGPKTRHCPHCGADRTGLKADYCDTPECQEAKREYRKAYRREWMRMGSRTRHKPDKKRVCQGWLKYKNCLHYIDNGNRLWCSYCHGLVTQIYCSVDANMEAAL